jgi:pantetheine-phosphate adenylyltransferase
MGVAVATDTVPPHTMTTVLYPGSFDPIHLGHLDVIEQSAELFTSPDKGVVVVAVMHNHDKPGGVFTVDERVRLITESAAAAGLADRVTVVAHSGLAVDAARDAGARFIVRGLRNAGDFEIEQQMALTNHSVTGVRTVYLPCRADRGYISSRFVREIARYGGSVTHMVPQCVDRALREQFQDIERSDPTP